MCEMGIDTEYEAKLNKMTDVGLEWVKNHKFLSKFLRAKLTTAYFGLYKKNFAVKILERHIDKKCDDVSGVMMDVCLMKIGNHIAKDRRNKRTGNKLHSN